MTMAHQEIIIAGFGGQGILSAGRILAYAGMLEGREVSWMPSYGPEMRGGTANCHVIISDRPVGSPIITRSTAVVAMNTPSYEKFLPTLAPGALMISDSSLVHSQAERPDVRWAMIPATDEMAATGRQAYACIMLLGKLVAETGIVSRASFEKGLENVLPAKYHHLIPQEMEVFDAGYGYSDI
jgi:2-oxoglutarate ferredoxin oxidoreductase subunit gamma